MDNRPRGRQKNITGTGKGMQRRGSGLGTGPVGSQNGYSGRNGSGASGGNRATGVTRGRGSLIGIIIAAVLLLGGGGGLLGGLTGGSSSSSQSQQNYSTPAPVVQTASPQSGIPSGYSSLFNFSGGSTSSGWDYTANTGTLDRSVASGAREKRTEIYGNGQDTVTIMVYMCGTDLESRSGMATYDLQEMAAATLSDKVNLLVYTGGCSGWKNNIISSSVNQIYKVESGGLKTQERDMGNKAMTSPATLTEFIQWCGKKYPANRNVLISWDHGGGSISGYGYDEKNKSAGSMNLRGIDQALKNAGMQFDFIGFDACLMATTENALMLSEYADYMVASEETEPGIGWYYTGWLNKLSANTSMPTVEIGKNICDDFVDVCAQKCSGQKATLSVVDLAELEATVPAELSAFGSSTAELIQNDGYQTVASARSGAREFASSNKIDQIDLIHLAKNMGTDAGNALADALLGAVKYNRTASCITDAYGLSIFFPYRKLSSVDNAAATYDAIGMESEYTRCIQTFASMETAGQTISGGASSPTGMLSGSGSASAGTYASSTDMISSLLGSLMGGSFNGVSGLNGSNTGYLGKSLDVDSAAQYLGDHRLDANSLVWTSGADGTPELRLSEDQWALVEDLELNVFFDDGQGYMDLGLDNVFDFTQDGALIGAYDGTWLAINDQPVAYYHTDTLDDGENYTITGRVPVLLNSQRADLILVFDNENPYGYIAGARTDYVDGETETVAKSLTELEIGDKLDFVCDYYSYDGTYQDSYLFGDPMEVTENMVISNVYIDASAASASYRITDIYQQQYWLPKIS